MPKEKSVKPSEKSKPVAKPDTAESKTKPATKAVATESEVKPVKKTPAKKDVTAEVKTEKAATAETVGKTAPKAEPAAAKKAPAEKPVEKAAKKAVAVKAAKKAPSKAKPAAKAVKKAPAAKPAEAVAESAPVEVAPTEERYTSPRRSVYRVGMLPVREDRGPGRRDVCPSQGAGEAELRCEGHSSEVQMHSLGIPGEDGLPRLVPDGSLRGRPVVLCGHHGICLGWRGL